MLDWMRQNALAILFYLLLATALPFLYLLVERATQ